MRMNGRLAALLVLTGGLLAGCAESPSECLEPYVPAGPAVSSSCDCTDGIFYLCSGADVCAGVVGRSSCEPAGIGHFLTVARGCDACRVRFSDAGAAFVECDAGWSDSAP